MNLICENLNLDDIMELIYEIIGLILQSIKLIYQSTSHFPAPYTRSSGLVVSSLYRWVSFGKWSTKGMITFP